MRERTNVKTTLSEREGNTVKFAVEVSAEELKDAFDTRLKQLAQEVRIPGFRRGKVPLAMARQRLGDEAVLADAVKESMDGWYDAAIIELDLAAVDLPQIDLDGDGPELGKPLGFTAAVTVMPDVVLGEYKGIEAPKYPVEVQDQEVDAQIERLRNEFAELRPVSGRAVQKGDFVTADFRAALDGEPVDGFDASDFMFEVGGESVLPEIEERAVGMKAGEELTFPLALSEGRAGECDLEAATIEFTIALREIKEKILPPLSDQWVSQMSELRTALELRQQVRERLQESKTSSSDQQFRSRAVQAAVDNATLDLPDVVVRQRAESMFSDLRRSLKPQSGTFEDQLEASGTSVEKVIEDMKPQAANQLKTGMVLDAVAEAEGIEATDDEISAVVGQVAADGGLDAGTLESGLRQSGRIEVFKLQIRRDKAGDFIVANAVALAPETVPVQAAPGEQPASEAAAIEQDVVEPATPEPAAEITTEEA
jgi:trigger factor